MNRRTNAREMMPTNVFMVLSPKDFDPAAKLARRARVTWEGGRSNTLPDTLLSVYCLHARRTRKKL
jgi:hypothetical protein